MGIGRVSVPVGTQMGRASQVGCNHLEDTIINIKEDKDDDDESIASS